MSVSITCRAFYTAELISHRRAVRLIASKNASVWPVHCELTASNLSSRKVVHSAQQFSSATGCWYSPPKKRLLLSGCGGMLYRQPARELFASQRDTSFDEPNSAYRHSTSHVSSKGLVDRIWAIHHNAFRCEKADWEKERTQLRGGKYVSQQLSMIIDLAPCRCIDQNCFAPWCNHGIWVAMTLHTFLRSSVLDNKWRMVQLTKLWYTFKFPYVILWS